MSRLPIRRSPSDFNISLDGAKYHVSEILARLGVSTREEAAAWEPASRPRDFPVLNFLWKAAAVLASAAALAGVGLLAYAVLTHGGANQIGVGPPFLGYPVAPVSQVQLAYMLPSGTTDDSPYYLRTVGSSGPDLSLGKYSPAAALTNNSPYANVQRYLWAMSPINGTSILNVATGVSRASPQQSNTTAAILVSRNGTIYEVNGVDGDPIIGQGPDGATIATYPLPDVPFAELYRPPGQKGGVSLGSAVTVASLLEGPEGHILAFASNGGNSALVDLDDERRLDFPSYGVFTATLAADGSVYALLISNDAARQYEVARIDEATMTLDGLIPVTIDPSAGTDSMVLVSTQSGPTFLFVTQETPSPPKNSTNPPTPNGQRSYLWRFDPATSDAQPVPLPDSIGIYATLGIDGNIYFYGGFAGPSVSMYDVANDSFNGEVARAPDGSYTQAVFVR